MQTLTDFLLARIEEDEAAARLVLRYQVLHEEGWSTDKARGFGRQGYVDQVRAMAECEAKRRIVELHRPRVVELWDRCGHPGCEEYHGLRPPPACQECGVSSMPGCETLFALASVYADHPDYRKWRP